MRSNDPENHPLKWALAQSQARANLFVALYYQCLDDLARMRAELQQKDGELARDRELRAHLDNVLNSASWRATAPLRALVGWARRRF